MKEELLEIFENVNNWLRFAEAKNGVLIALNGGALIGIATNLEKFSGFSSDIKLAGYYFVGCLIIGLILSLWSFLPSSKIYWEETSNFNNVNPDSLSLIFFRHIRRFEHKDYLKRLYHAKGVALPDPLPPLEVDFSHQITQNSRTTWLKYQIFFWAISITLSGLIIPIPFIIIRWICIKLKK